LIVCITAGLVRIGSSRSAVLRSVLSKRICVYYSKGCYLYASVGEMYIKTEYCCSYAYQHWTRPDTRMVFRADINTPITAHHLTSYTLDSTK
jgi:hypothetical protein